MPFERASIGLGVIKFSRKLNLVSQPVFFLMILCRLKE